MLARQGGVCAICNKKPDNNKSLCVDHCHKTGKVRGLLCSKCNSVLAFCNDEAGILRAAIAYLRASVTATRAVQVKKEQAGAGKPGVRPADIVGCDVKSYESGAT